MKKKGFREIFWDFPPQGDLPPTGLSSNELVSKAVATTPEVDCVGVGISVEFVCPFERASAIFMLRGKSMFPENVFHVPTSGMFDSSFCLGCKRRLKTFSTAELLLASPH